MPTSAQKWWDGNSTRLWRISVIAYMAVIGFLASWIFVEVATVPKVYADKQHVQEIAQEMRHGFECLGNKIDEINRHLRNREPHEK